MILDYVPKTRAFTLRVPRGEANTSELMSEHGLDFSVPASTDAEAVLFTREPYAALSFYDRGTEAAKRELADIARQVASSWAETSSLSVPLPPTRELWPFQLADLEYALARRHTLIGDQPGLGKTPTAIGFANAIAAKRVLVICPASIRLQWCERIAQWTTMDWPYSIYPILKGSHGVSPTANWMVVSYELARAPAIAKALSRFDFDLTILDEAHYLKTVGSKRTSSILGAWSDTSGNSVLEHSARVLALTGTPLPNRPREAYTLARSLCFDAIDWMSEDDFRARFNPSQRFDVVDPETGRTKFYTDERTGRHGELQARLRANFMVRHLKADVLTQLKLPEFDVVEFEPTGATKMALKAESLLHIDPDNLDGVDFLDGHIAAIRHQEGVGLAPDVANYCTMLVEGGDNKLVVFAWHIEVLNILEKAFKHYGVLRIDGSTSATKRKWITEQFRQDPSRQILIGNMQALGIGTDGLQEVCSRGVIAEPDWVFGNNQQAIDRLHRIGQGGKVLIDFCCIQGSVLSYILNRALTKGRTTDKALDARSYGALH